MIYDVTYIFVSQLSVDYYQRCGCRGRAGLSAMLQHRALALAVTSTNEDSSSQLAPKLMQLCEQFALDAERDLVCRLMIQTSLRILITSGFVLT